MGCSCLIEQGGPMHTTMRSTTISTKPRTVSFDIKPSASLKRSLWAGAVTGEVAGLTMAGVLMAVFPLFLGRGPQYPRAGYFLGSTW